MEDKNDVLRIYDWDDTLQTIKEIRSSFMFFFDTLFTKLNIGIEEPLETDDLIGISLREILEDDDSIICTSRSKLYTYAIRLCCFLKIPSLKWFSNYKVTTINEDFFYHENHRLDLCDKVVMMKVWKCFLDLMKPDKDLYIHILYFDEGLPYGSEYFNYLKGRVHNVFD